MNLKLHLGILFGLWPLHYRHLCLLFFYKERGESKFHRLFVSCCVVITGHSKQFELIFGYTFPEGGLLTITSALLAFYLKKIYILECFHYPHFCFLFLLHSKG